jgi:hypothetical protein
VLLLLLLLSDFFWLAAGKKASSQFVQLALHTSFVMSRIVATRAAQNSGRCSSGLSSAVPCVCDTAELIASRWYVHIVRHRDSTVSQAVAPMFSAKELSATVYSHLHICTTTESGANEVMACTTAYTTTSEEDCIFLRCSCSLLGSNALGAPWNKSPVRWPAEPGEPAW